MAMTTIEWTEATWNPVTGCSKFSSGCQNCYAERMAGRLKAMGQPKYRNGFKLTVHPRALSIPMAWRKPRMVFVNSMSDLFHEEVPDDFIMQVFEVMREASWHTFQILTKRPHRLEELNGSIPWPANVWMGVTVEEGAYTDRLEPLKASDAAVKFVSFEPLLGSISDPDLDGIDWAIVGGESGPGARAIELQWVLDIRDACVRKSVPFFFKQWGGVHKTKAGRLLEGREWNQLPGFQPV
jgi:protein gp37